MGKVKTILAAILATITGTVTAFAGDTTGTANTAVVNAMTSAAADMKATGEAIIPIALGILVLSLVVIFGIRMFKKVSGTRG